MSKEKFVFNIDYEAIKELSKILSETHLTEIEYEDQGRRLRLTRASLAAPTTMITSAAAPVGIPQAEPVKIASVAPVTSPMVGVVYVASEPGSKPFVSVGQTVSANDTICIIEAMKIMNPIKATKSGVVKEIFFQDSTPVEFGEPLIVIE
jgi:acetyl-CoA carboxylase biotin carboxyl carrier protein